MEDRTLTTHAPNEQVRPHSVAERTLWVVLCLIIVFGIVAGSFMAHGFVTLPL